MIKIERDAQVYLIKIERDAQVYLINNERDAQVYLIKNERDAQVYLNKNLLCSIIGCLHKDLHISSTQIIGEIFRIEHSLR